MPKLLPPQIVLSLLSVCLLLASCSQTNAFDDSLRRGRLALQEGRVVDAVSLLQESTNAASSTGIKDQRVINAYLDLSNAYVANHEDGKALEALNSAHRIALEFGGKNNELLIPIYKQIAKLHYRKKEFVESGDAAREALRLERSCCEPQSEKLLDSLNLCIASACALDRCADTQPWLEEQLEIRKLRLGAQHPHVAVSLCLIGEILEKKRRWKEAEAKYLEALAIRRKAEPALVAQTEKNLLRVREKIKD
ncbi:MAG: tetratricopeptide repeat protein [Candidatus Obscuribacterales bacterium]|nr:tetratricopeptide repeat protein [Candidatus Obscuribacterales bacterium]